MSETQEEMKTDDWGDYIEWSDTFDINDSSHEDWGEAKSALGILPNMGDFYMVLFNDKKLFLGTVNNVENEEGKYFTLKNDSKSLLFQTEDNGVLKMKTDDYEILDIKKLKKYDMKLLEIPESLEEKYSEINEIAYTLVNDKDREYSKRELKEMLISTLYREYNSQNISKTIEEIIEYADILLDISGEQKKEKINMGKWYIPIITNKTKIYSEEKEIFDEIKELIDNDMLIVDSNTKGDKNYTSLMKKLLHSWDNIIHEEDDNGTLIADYDGKVYRNCVDMNNCLGINGLYTFDEIKNNHSLKIPSSFDRITGDSNFYELRKPMKINISGILTIPYHYFPFICENLLDTDKLTLYEKCILQELVKQTNIHKRNNFKKNKVTSKTYKKDGYNYDLNTFTIHNLESKDKNELLNDIKYIKPSVSDILQNLDDKIKNSLKNYEDITKIFVNYDIDNYEIDSSHKIVNKILTNNTKKSIENSKIFKIKTKKVVKKELTIERRIELSKEIIFSMLNISQRNALTKRFIDTFCIDSSDEIDWFVGIHDKKRLLCKHYDYLSKNNEDSFFMMKQKYQRLPITDGNIYCKNCGEFICKEEFSHDDGFADDLPTSTKEIIIEDKDLFEKYDESEMNNIGLIRNISQALGTEMKDEDLVFINDIYIELSEDIIANKRYDTLNITTGDEHPRVAEIKKQYKKDKKSLTKAMKSFQIFLKITNRLMVFISLSLILITINIPIYESKYIKDFKLFKDHKNLNKDFIGKIVLVLKKLSHIFGEKYEKVYNDLINEKKKYDVLNVADQIFNLITFFLSSNFSQILTKYEEYLRFTKITEKVYINYEWPVYKPLSDNKLVMSINKIVKDDETNKDVLLKTYNSTNVENITCVTAIDDYNLHDILDINRNELINTAFQRLFNISASLYGKLEKPSFYIDTNIEKLFNDSNEDIKEICIKNGWNNKTKTLGPVNFQTLRKNLIPDLLKYVYKTSENDLEPCFTIKENCNEFIHVNVNNYDLRLINVQSKRFYSHVTPEIFPQDNYSIISDTIKDKIFKIFAFDPSNNIIKKELNTTYLGKFIIDITNIIDVNVEDKSREFEKDIPKTEKNFHRIINFMHKKARLVSSYINLPSEININNLKALQNISFFKEYIRLLDEEIYDFDIQKFITILETIEEDKKSFKSLQKDLNEIYLNIEEMNDKLLGGISEYIFQYFKDYPKLKDEFQYIFIPGKKSHINIPKEDREKLESFGSINYRNLTEKNIEDIFRILIEEESFDFEYLKEISNEILYILSNIINSGYKNSYIPKSWRLSEQNKDWYKNYVDTHYFSHHKDIYKKNNFKDFSKFFSKSNMRFLGLFNKIKDITKFIDIQRNTSKNILTENIKSLWKHIFLNIMNSLITYSDYIRDEEGVEEQKEEDIENLEVFSLELITHLLEKRYDTTWIYSNKENLNELLGIQKEREKQTLIHKLDGMTNDKRHAATELHTIGTKNYFKASELENMEHIEDDNYKNETDDFSYINQLMNGTSIEESNFVIDDDLVNDNYDTGEIIDDDGGSLD